MKLKLLGAAIAVVMMCAPASAARLFNVSISGTVTGVTETILCNSGSSEGCLRETGGGFSTAPFSNDFSRDLGTILLSEGDNRFSFGFARGSGSFEGIINLADGFLTGRDLFFFREDSTFRFGGIGSTQTRAGASTFNVTGGIPEPATWAMMIGGFGMVGGAMRSARRKRKVTVSYA